MDAAQHRTAMAPAPGRHLGLGSPAPPVPSNGVCLQKGRGRLLCWRHKCERRDEWKLALTGLRVAGSRRRMTNHEVGRHDGPLVDRALLTATSPGPKLGHLIIRHVGCGLL